MFERVAPRRLFVPGDQVLAVAYVRMANRGPGYSATVAFAAPLVATTIRDEGETTPSPSQRQDSRRRRRSVPSKSSAADGPGACSGDEAILAVGSGHLRLLQAAHITDARRHGPAPCSAFAPRQTKGIKALQSLTTSSKRWSWRSCGPHTSCEPSATRPGCARSKTRHVTAAASRRNANACGRS
jgi:hypothetical protein